MPAIDVDRLIDVCAADVAHSTMAAIVKVESAGNPWAIGDNTTRQKVRPAARSYGEAVVLAESLIDAGHNLDLGLAQINSRNLKRLGLSVAEVMQPCTNLSAGATILKGFYQRASGKYGPGTKALLHALSGYNTGSLYAGVGYVKRIIDASNSPVKLGSYRWEERPRNTPYTVTKASYTPQRSPILVFPLADQSETIAPQQSEPDPAILVSN